jgi:multiple sugar transport system ATP-binding protein
VLRDVTKRFGSATVIDRLTLTISDGELFVLLGPSGCGKSTVLRMIAGLEDPTEGTIEMGGIQLEDVDAKDRDIAMVFQSYALYPHMTVRRNIEFPLRSRGVGSAERETVVADASRILDLAGLLDRKPSQLSGGQRQRVALARAIVRRPAVFLMDEPLSNLDAKLRVQTRAELVELHRRLQTTLVYVTHDQGEAMTMGQRIAVMDRGVIQQVGPPQAVYDRPANLMVAGFIGSPPMNLASAILAPSAPAGTDAGTVVAQFAGASLELDPAQVKTVRSREVHQVTIGIRPEDLVIDDQGPIAATVAVVENLGHERHVACRLDEGTLWIARTEARHSCPDPGETVHLAPRPGRLHLFDAQSGDHLDG